MSTQYVRRDKAVLNRPLVKQYEARLIGYEASKKLQYLRGWTCSRSKLREKYSHPFAEYRTCLSQVHDQTIWLSVREILPGEYAPDDAFFEEFVDCVRRYGYCSFDTERNAHPVMVQVKCVVGLKLTVFCGNSSDATMLKCNFGDNKKNCPCFFSSLPRTGSPTFSISRRPYHNF